MQTARHAGSWVLQILVALTLGFAAYGKFASEETAVNAFTILGMEPLGRYLIAVLEGLVALMMLLPFSAPWGAVLGWGVMTGALIAHATHLGWSGPAGTMALAAAITWLACTAIIALRHDQVPLVRLLFTRESVDPTHGG